MKILAVDTSAAAASAAIYDDFFLRGEYYVNIKQKHSQTIMPMAVSLMKSCQITPAEIDLFAVSCGPGSFTGVRIGVAAIKGLALPLGKPCAAVSSLEALAYNLSGTNAVICAVMDARRNQFYNAMFECENGNVKRLSEDRAISYSALETEITSVIASGKILMLIGDGAKICYNKLGGMSGVYLAPPNLMFARASSVAQAAAALFAEGKTTSAENLLPAYLRLPQAERELRARGG